MAQKPSISKGTRDFTPEEVQKRNYIISKMRHAFELFGFSPIETPSFENLETLTGKYGEEGDQLIFRILKSGNFANKVNDQDWQQKDISRLAAQVSDKALRYDLTVPFARFVVQHQNELAFPFKRYQIQPVWRADRPQKGRFREFYQCDADVVGSASLWQEVEFIQLYNAIFKQLGLDVTIRLSNRKLLEGIAEVLGFDNDFTSFTVAVDKLDKIGADGVVNDLRKRGSDEDSLAKLEDFLKKSEAQGDLLPYLEDILSISEVGLKGLEEVNFVMQESSKLNLENKLVLDVTLARGLNYYTGSIFEVVANGVQMSSIGGGGRYDDLTGIFGLKNLSGVGISFGLDRIYLCLEELNLFPQAAEQSTKVLFLNFGDKESSAAMRLINELRQADISAELYPDSAKLKKQFDYATKKQVRYVAFLGSQEIDEKLIKLKNQNSGEQHEVAFASLIDFLKEN